MSNIFYHFLFAVSLGNMVSKMSKKFRLDGKIGFQNMFYTKFINVTIDSFGHSIILRSIYFRQQLEGKSLCIQISLRKQWMCIMQRRLMGKGKIMKNPNMIIGTKLK